MIIKIFAWGAYVLIETVYAIATAPKKFADAVANEVQAIYDRRKVKGDE